MTSLFSTHLIGWCKVIIELKVTFISLCGPGSVRFSPLKNVFFSCLLPKMSNCDHTDYRYKVRHCRGVSTFLCWRGRCLSSLSKSEIQIHLRRTRFDTWHIQKSNHKETLNLQHRLELLIKRARVCISTNTDAMSATAASYKLTS